MNANPDEILLVQCYYDYAAVFIETPFSGISTFIPLGFDVDPNSLGVSTAGYPVQVRDQESLDMWFSFGEAVEFEERLLLLATDISPGSSGSPIWIFDPQTSTRRVIGISTFFQSVNDEAVPDGGTRLVSENESLIREWMEWRPSAPALGNISAIGVASDSTPFIACSIVEQPGVDILVLAESVGDPVVDPVLYLAPVNVSPAEVRNNALASNDNFGGGVAPVINRPLAHATDSLILVPDIAPGAYCAFAFTAPGTSGSVSIQINDADLFE